MTIKWKIFRAAAALQMIITLLLTGFSAYNLMFYGNFFYNLLNTSGYACMFLLARMGVSIVNNNYPDIPLSDKEKTNFNWLFLINFFLLAFSSAHVFAEIRQVRNLINDVGDASIIPLPVYLPLAIESSAFLLQIYMLFGLYQLRIEINRNFRGSRFEFENE